MQPLKITFQLASPVVIPENPIHFDGVLARAAVERAGFDLTAQDHLPLDRYTCGDAYVWKASWVEFTGISNRWMVDSIRRFEPWQRARDQLHGALRTFKKITPGTGPDKAYQFFTPVMRAAQAYAYCIGDRSEIADLLKNITHLGKLKRLGYGLIQDVEILPDSTAETAWTRRIMPCKLDDSYVPVWACLNPPYWERRRCVRAFRPSMF